MKLQNENEVSLEELAKEIKEEFGGTSDEYFELFLNNLITLGEIIDQVKDKE